MDPQPLTALHLDGKVLRNADPAPPRLQGGVSPGPARQLLPYTLPPRPPTRTLEKGHGRIEERRIWVLPVDGAVVGFPGAVQIFRIEPTT